MRQMNTVLAAVVVWGLTPAISAAAIINVHADFATIQAAINAAAVSGDEIIVAPGTYPEVINFNGKAINLHSASGTPADTIIDGTGLNDSVVLCISGERSGTILEGFTITGGTGNTSVFGGNFPKGGGMLNNGSSPTVTNCAISGNSASLGGGMYNTSNSSPTVINCTFSGNTATGTFDSGGGGMSNSGNSSPMVTNCTFSGNTAMLHGGGMHNRASSPTVTHCIFSGNAAFGAGGGMMNLENSNPAVTNCTFRGNSCQSGGGMLNNTSNPTVTNCVFRGNTAVSGGGMFNVLNSPTIINCIFSGNTAGGRGGGLYTNFNSSPTVTNCVFSENTAGVGGGGITNMDVSSSPMMTNCILWGDIPNEIENIFGSSASFSFSNVQGGLPPGTIDGGGNIHVDPLFFDADGPDNIPGTPDDDLRLAHGSPCIDAGDNTAVSIDITTDFDGDPRFVDDPASPDTGFGTPPIVDMGAYEFQGGGLIALLDIEPGECPNEFIPRLGNSNHRIKVALVGTAEFAVNQVDVSTLLLARADGTGGTILPSQVRIRDRATPFIGDPCGCHELKKDGVPDLMMRFFATDMTTNFELANLLEGTEVELILSGTLLDGTPFSARDCITIE